MNTLAVGTKNAQSSRVATRQPKSQVKSIALRVFIIGLSITVTFTVVAEQLIRLAVIGQNRQNTNTSQTIGEFYSRPDIVDRHGRLLATDIALPALFADSHLITSVDETIESIKNIFPELNTTKVRRALSDKNRRYYLLKRAVAPRVAETINAMGLPGLGFRSEPKRKYPNVRLAGHLLGYVDSYNYGVTGVEHLLNRNKGVRRVDHATVNTASPLRLTIDVRTQYALERELIAGIKKFKAKAATGVLFEVQNGEIWAAASLPGVEPANINEMMDRSRRDRLASDAFELGSVFRLFTLAMVMDLDIVTPKALVDVTNPIKIESFVISDENPFAGKLSLEQIMIRSSNVGSGILAEATGSERQHSFFERIGLTRAINREDIKTISPV